MKNNTNCIFPSGFQALDDITGGFKPGKLYLIGGRPAMGKTSLMLDMALNIASALNPVYIFSLETSEAQLVKILFSKISAHKNNNILKTYTDDIDHFPIYIRDKPMSFDEMTETIKAEITEGIVFIDYLQLIDAKTDIHLSAYALSEKRTRISKAFKELAIQKELPIVITSQLSRAIDSRYDKRPRLYDIRYEGMAKSSDGVIFIYRNAYYYPHINDTAAELIVAKNDNGSLGTAIVHYDQTHCLTFERI